MHRSQLAGFIIDCQTDDLAGAAGFWSGALGFAVRPSEANEDAGYALLDSESRGLHIEVQRVEHPSRVHLDIETDDIEAEVCRLEKLGAKRLRQVHSWWVMEAPTGQRFCVVRAQSASFMQTARLWPG